MDKKTESLEAVEKMLKKLRKKQRETGKVDKKKLKSKKETGKKLDLNKLPGSKESIDNSDIFKKYEGAVRNKAMGGDLKTEYRGGGMVNLGNFKGQF